MKKKIASQNTQWLTVNFDGDSDFIGGIADGGSEGVSAKVITGNIVDR